MNPSSKRSLRPQKKDLSGKTLYGKHRLVERIGGDSNFVLYEADDLIGKRKVAIAVLEPGVKVDPDLKAPAHPNLAAVHEVIEKDGEAKFVVAERPAGKSLEAVLAKRGKVEPALAVTAVMQILSALHSIHDRGRVHGSLDPGNIFFERSEDRLLQITLVDVAAKPGAGLPDEPRYLSPEQVIGEGGVDRRTDIWTVGVLLYEMLLGVPPFDGKNRDEITGMILLKDPPVDAKSIGAPEDLAAFLEKALSKEPDDRYENVTAAQGDLLLVNEEFEDLVAPAVAAALRESINPPPPPAAAMKRPAQPRPKVDLPPALALFGKDEKKPADESGPDTTAEPPGGSPPQPGKRPPPLPERKPQGSAKTMQWMGGRIQSPQAGPPPLKGPPPLPEQKPLDAAMTMRRMDGKPKTEPVEFEVAQPEGEDERATTPSDSNDEQATVGSAEPETETPAAKPAAAESTAETTDLTDEDRRTTAPADGSAAVEEDEWGRSSIEGRTTLPAPSGVFEELDSLAVAEESRRVAAEIDARAAGAPAASPAPAPAPSTEAPKKRVSPTLVVSVIAVAAVAGFVAVLLNALSTEDEEPRPAVAAPELPPQPETATGPAEPAQPEQAEPAQPQQTEPAQPQQTEPAQPEQTEPEQPEQAEPHEAVSSPDADEVTITLEGVPDGALIKLNGERATAPIRLPKSNKKVTLGVYLAGYHSHWERFAPTEDRVIEVKMPKKKGGGGQEGDDQSWADNPWKK